MIESDNSKNLELSIIGLFLQSNTISHEFYNSLDRQLKLFAELYVYSDFFYNISCKKDLVNKVTVQQKEEILKNLDIILDKNYIITNTSDIDFIGELFNSIMEFTSDDRMNIVKKIGEKYKGMSASIIRKMKIKLLLNERQ